MKKNRHLELSDNIKIDKTKVTNYDFKDGQVTVKYIDGTKLILTKEQTQEFSDFYNLNLPV